MKKFIIVIFLAIFLVSCSSKDLDSKKDDKYVKVEDSMSAFDKAKANSKKLSASEATEINAVTNIENKAQTNEKKNINYTICIDPGHQRKQITTPEPLAPGSNEKKPGVSSGATGISTKKEEYELNLEVSMILKGKLEAKGYNVVMTRTTNDVSLTNIDRAKIGNESNANLVVRIHADSNESSAVTGFSILYPSGEYAKGIEEESKKASEFIEKKMKESTGSLSRGIVPRSDMTGFNWSKVPSVIVEMGFLSNPNEDRLMSDKNYQDKITNGIIMGVESYLSNSK
ncbi:N-acetylmuramoyl-L-alanine amidase [Clostridium cylindrosporum]|uniref:N-acetylmuramoyl-L-alanine amidase family protein n=1 Tax=Clostridium cylindrosporum DSM 605 TaxID=1121307 RepID=A0A0J8DDD5_CLOCY|nr:N-acetylmuramoyl-L-alanine amidase [Clostridium cylindrosporum]KMT22248.1 N-acetylmuramoyl-L-alanine amidase family protein [Clostridium cylindrosporum DSM 605]